MLDRISRQSRRRDAEPLKNPEPRLQSDGRVGLPSRTRDTWSQVKAMLRGASLFYLAGGMGVRSLAEAAHEPCDHIALGLHGYPLTHRQPHARNTLGRATELTRDSGRKQRGGARRRRSRPRVPRLEFVIGRHDEDLSWIFKVPSNWKITVYSSGTADDPPPWPATTRPQNPFDIVPIERKALGKESNYYAHHLARRYESLAEFTVFSPTFPLQQSPHLLSMLMHPAMLSAVQTMSTGVSPDFPPEFVIKNLRQDPWFRSDTYSLFTLQSLAFVDCCIHEAAAQYRDFYNLTEGTNLLTHLFDSIGLPNWVPESQEEGNFAFGSIFGVARSRVTQHPVEIYEHIGPVLQKHIQAAFLMERAWMMLFGGADYIDKKPTPW